MNTHLWPHIIEFAYVIVNIKTNKIVKWKNDLIKIPENVTLQGEEVMEYHAPSWTSTVKDCLMFCVSFVSTVKMYHN